MKSLLVELLVEELPPKALKQLGESFAQGLAAGLRAQGLASEHSAVTAYASPRRLAAHISAVRAQAEDRPQTHKLMPVAVGLDAAGAPTPALLKKLGALGADASAVAQLGRSGEGKAAMLVLESVASGALLAAGLQQALDEAIARLPIPKVMRYQLESGEGVEPGWTSVDFVRPAHGLVALHGAELVPVRALGLTSRRETHGHRFEAAMDPVMLLDADHYARQLEEQGAVIASFEARHGEIARQLQAAAAREGLQVAEDAALLDEVTALVERPNVLTCGFDADFLEVPAECLILTMKANQKYFPLLAAAEGEGGRPRLSHRFLVVSNISPADPARVIEGNERVVRPRLADARFFYDQDRKRSLASRVDGLSRVVYHGRLGSQRERVERVRAIAAAIAGRLDPALAADVDRAALLAKADLLTDMVGEFPELQGVMGGYYARHDGESEAVAEAIEDHYRPRFAGDALPRGPVGLVLALADKLETLVGLFGIGQLPSGDKDPFALRRHALGVVRMLAERELPLALDELLAAARPAFGTLIEDPTEALGRFIHERLAGSLREQFRPQEVDAVLALRPQRLAEVGPRLAALRSFAELPEAEPLAAANKRVANILRKSEGIDAGAGVDPALLVEPAERRLQAALAERVPQADAAFERADYTGSLRILAALREPVDAFFAEVMVNADDAALRRNRLALLASLHAAMNRVAELARLSS